MSNDHYADAQKICFCSIAEAMAYFFIRGYHTIEDGDGYVLMRHSDHRCVVKITKIGFLEVEAHVQEER